MNEDFKKLKSHKESQLSTEEKITYYQNLREYYKIQKISKSYVNATTFVHPLLRETMYLDRKYKIKMMNLPPVKKEYPVIYVVNHSNMHDVPTAMKIIKDHFFLLAGDEVKGTIPGLLFSLNGVCWVDRSDPIDMERAKDEMIKYVMHGHSVLEFPDTTWNISPNLLMYPFPWGVIEIAQKTCAPIVPIVTEYIEDTCYVTVGEEKYYTPYDNKEEAIRELRDTMATARWNTWEQFPVLSRNEVEPKNLGDYIDQNLKEYKRLDVEKEQSYIFKDHDSYKDVFNFLNKIEVTPQNVFTFKKEFIRPML